jgi:hypothetical protein
VPDDRTPRSSSTAVAPLPGVICPRCSVDYYRITSCDTEVNPAIHALRVDISDQKPFDEDPSSKLAVCGGWVALPSYLGLWILDRGLSRVG